MYKHLSEKCPSLYFAHNFADSPVVYNPDTIFKSYDLEIWHTFMDYLLLPCENL